MADRHPGRDFSIRGRRRRQQDFGNLHVVGDCHGADADRVDRHASGGDRFEIIGITRRLRAVGQHDYRRQRALVVVGGEVGERMHEARSLARGRHRGDRHGRAQAVVEVEDRGLFAAAKACCNEPFRCIQP